MTTVVPSTRRHGTSFLHRHHSGSMSNVNSVSGTPSPRIFEGTDEVPQNRKVAVQRIVEVHNALEAKHHDESASTGRSSNSTSMSSDAFSLDFDLVELLNGEVRTFRYFLRKWDDKQLPDPEFDRVIRPNLFDFEQAAIKHFFRRIALWHESEEVLQAAKDEMKKRLKKDKKKAKDSQLGNLWMQEKGRGDHNMRDELKEVTTREGLAQLIWTLMHDQTAPLAPELFAECTDAVKRRYGIKQ
ncbi:hypothetical protein FB567DRAFT_518233 [Paraphoma chrysanthemicola]|uniref:Uncharacterized protein n=1 Tax=Paraphoma chrysanthemicola TaxID=798071 RepID=A0A8K0RC84_9PLEO|nr:hypothetical protein FB567DRAFT_518233 [Paraphoma chrysanthemicola]